MPGLRGTPHGDDADIGARDIGVILRALQRGVEAFGGTRLGNVERLALGRALGNIEKNDIAQFLQRGEVGKRATDLPCADKRDLGSGHGFLLRFGQNSSDGLSNRAASRKPAALQREKCRG